MSGRKMPASSRSDHPSITYRRKHARGTSIDLSDFVCKENSPTVSDNNNKSSTTSGPKSREILSSTKLISTVGQIWNTLGTLPISKPDAELNPIVGYRKSFVLDACGVQFGRDPPPDWDNKDFCIDRRINRVTNLTVQPKPKFLTVIQKMSAFDPHSENQASSLFSLFFNRGTNFSNESWKEKGITSVGISYEFEKVYGWMKESIPAGSQYGLHITGIESKKNSKRCNSESTIHPSDNEAFTTANCYSDSLTSENKSVCDSEERASNTQTTNSLHSDYFLGALHDNNLNSSISTAPDPSLCADSCVESITPSNSTHEKLQYTRDTDELPQNIRKPPRNIIVKEKSGNEVNYFSSQGSARHALAKQEHAFAGAFAGAFVSLCLHPVDTIKTVTQSRRAEQKSVLNIGRSIISERGVTGLYRGIVSNIASSAPISAIYTFTYESVKGSLIPLLPKEYHSFGHCIAGGCSSIATSFVFTPSERIKQQMQIGSHYNNCWSALVGILRNGGLHSLYNGWCAVLCRNVPHSIIKFYIYESLKQLALPSENSIAGPSTLQTLVCGGLAGSSAAFFTTPFDVVKTRLQTQIPGSMSQYHSVFHALQIIGKNEGLKGLYRGLIPRLVIYMSQGALFFASYESFKRLFSLDVNSQRIQYKEDDSTPLQKMSS